jgi:SAM-dependent methyltransferase
MDQALLKDFFEEENTHWWHTAKRKMISAFLPRGHGSILVLGVGGGLLCYELSKTFDVVAVDISSVACEHVKNTYGLNAIVCDIGKGLPFAGEKFDVIIMADVLEHIRDDKKVLSEIRRCLTKGGTLLLTVPAYEHMWSYWDERLHHCRRYEYKTLKGLIGSEDFKIRKITFFNALIYPAAFIRRKLIRFKEDGVSDFKISQGGGLINRMIGFYYAAERGWIHFGTIPFGLSLFVCAEKS